MMEVLGAAGPYRAPLRRQLPPPAPRVSATWTVIALLASLGVAALALPRMASLPRWVEAELVVLCWWLVWSAVLSILLYRGFRLEDDWVYFTPWDRWRHRAKNNPSSESSPPASSTKSKYDIGCADDLDAVLVLLVFFVLLGAAWAFVELALPLAFMLAYMLILRALRRVAKDRHGCKGRLGPALGWGVLWATIYVAPLGGVILLLERMIGS